MSMRSIIAFILCFLGMVISTIILVTIRNEYIVNWVSVNQSIAKILLLPVNVVYVWFFSYIIARQIIVNHIKVDLLIIGVILVCCAVILEFVIGYFVERRTVMEMLKEYNLLAGNTWVIVLMMILIFPKIAYWWINKSMK